MGDDEGDLSAVQIMVDLVNPVGVLEVLVALDNHAGTARLDQIEATTPELTRGALLGALRRLAAAGQVTNVDGGTWDDTDAASHVALTDSGHLLVRALTGLEQWAKCHQLLRRMGRR